MSLDDAAVILGTRRRMRTLGPHHVPKEVFPIKVYTLGNWTKSNNVAIADSILGASLELSDNVRNPPVTSR